MSSHGKFFALAFLVIVLMGTPFVFAIVINNNNPVVGVYGDPTETANQTMGMVQTFTGTGNSFLLAILPLAAVFLIISVLLMLRIKRTR
jgi:ABC-type branched-subunit amino acid transport system permease subunit